MNQLVKRICACGCEKTFECMESSKKKFIPGHNTKLRQFLSCGTDPKKDFNKEEYMKKYGKENRKPFRKAFKKHYQKNAEKICKGGAEWYQANKKEMHRRAALKRKDPKYRKRESLRALDYRTSPETRPLYLLRARVSQARRRAGTATLTTETIQRVYEENIQKYGMLTCELCIGPIVFGDDHLEHFHPVDKKESYPGDVNERKNLGVAHRACNQSKGKRTLEEYKEYLLKVTQ